MYILKDQPEDFIVEENISPSIFSQEPTHYHVYLLTKKNYTTERAVRQVAFSLKKPRNKFSYAGTKDKKAITKQHIVIQGVSKEQVEKLVLEDISLEFKGYAKNHLRLGDLESNRFHIVIRNAPGPIQEKETFEVPNYFDDQRFSTQNVTIGMHLLKKEFDKITALLIEHDDDFSEKISAHLEKLPNDHIGAIRLLPRKTMLFFVHAVQSLLFNELLKKEITPTYTSSYSQGELYFADEYTFTHQLPLLGFEHDEHPILEEYGLSSRNFLITSMPELSLSGSMRNAFFTVKNFLAEEIDEVTKKVSFDLPKGCYATIVIRQLAARNGFDQQ